MSVCTAACLKALQNQSTHNSRDCSAASSVAVSPACAARPGARQRICQGGNAPVPCLAGLRWAGEGGHTQQGTDGTGTAPSPLPCPLCWLRDGRRSGEPSLQLQQVKDSSGLPVPRKASGCSRSQRPQLEEGADPRAQPGHPFQVPKHPGVPAQPPRRGQKGSLHEGFVQREMQCGAGVTMANP